MKEKVPFFLEEEWIELQVVRADRKRQWHWENRQPESFHSRSRLTEEDGYPDTQDQRSGKMEMLKVGAHTHSLVDHVC